MTCRIYTTMTPLLVRTNIRSFILYKKFSIYKISRLLYIMIHIIIIIIIIIITVIIC